MHPALLKLYGLQFRGLLRSMRRRVTTWRGAALTIFTLIVLGMIFGPNLVMVVAQGRPAVQADSQEMVREIVPVALLLFCLTSTVTSAGEKAIYFSPAEIEFLFPGPFTRRQLLVYKIAKNLVTAVFFGTLLATTSIVWVRSWVMAAVGIGLAFLFVNSVTLCTQLAAQIVSEHAFSRARRAVLLLVVVLIALGIFQAAAAGSQSSWLGSLQSFRESLAGRVLLAPFAVFGFVLSAERFFPEFFAWTALAALLVCGGYGTAIALDANYLETAVRVSQRIQDRVKRVRRQGAFATLSPKKLTTSRLPQFPWWAGCGPLARRQLLLALRGTAGVLVLLGIMVAAMLAPLLFGLRNRGGPDFLVPMATIGILAYITLLMSAQIPLAFRGDYDHLGFLKSLPIHPLSMACGQLSIVVALASAVQGIILLAVCLFYPASISVLSIAAAFAVPFNALLFGIENNLFLLFPSRVVVGGSAGFLQIGRTMLFMLVKTLLLALCGGAATLLALVVYLAAGNLLAGLAAGWCFLAAACVGLVFSLARAFARFDVALDAGD